MLVAGALVLVGGTAGAAPVNVDAQMGVALQGLGTVFVAGSGTVDKAAGGTVTVGAGLVGLDITTVIPVTGATAISYISAMTIFNGSGTFSAGGVGNQLPGEVCPGGGPVAGSACNPGGGFGGAMSVTGTVFVHVIPHVVVIPVNLNDALIGQGGSTDMPFTFDLAGWSTGAARVGLPDGSNGTLPVTTSGTESSFSSGGTMTLVTPTFVSALGNLLPIFTWIRFDQVSAHVPEPASLLLVGGGVAGLLAAAGARRA